MGSKVNLKGVKGAGHGMKASVGMVKSNQGTTLAGKFDTCMPGESTSSSCDQMKKSIPVGHNADAQNK